MYRVLDHLGLAATDKGGGRAVSNFERWLAARPDDAPPTFTFLNFIEAHFPYHQLPARYLTRFTTRPSHELHRLSMQLFAAQLGGEKIDVAQAAPLAAAMYDAGILYADHLLGRVVEALRRRGTLDRTVVVVLADHGELLGEHGEFGHGFSLYEPLLRVPLLVRYPPRIAGGTRVAPPVSTVGVFATILDLAGITPPPSLQVGSLVPATAGKAPPGPVLAEQFAAMLGSADTAAAADPLLRRQGRYRAYRVGTAKLVEAVPGGSFIFDLAADPAESRDRAGAEAAEAARLHDELETWRAALALPALDAAVKAGPAPEVDSAARARLRALGYVE
jgi:arylsulfatase A-like enzyme